MVFPRLPPLVMTRWATRRERRRPWLPLSPPWPPHPSQYGGGIDNGSGRRQGHNVRVGGGAVARCTAAATARGSRLSTAITAPAASTSTALMYFCLGSGRWQRLRCLAEASARRRWQRVVAPIRFEAVNFAGPARPVFLLSPRGCSPCCEVAVGAAVRGDGGGTRGRLRQRPPRPQQGARCLWCPP